MIFLSVIKNSKGDWEILKVLSSPINVRGNATGITYSDIRVLDFETRFKEGFWTQEDIYQNTGEYMEFKEKVTTFDETVAVVTNTYVYQQMDLQIIKDDLKNRTTSHRDSLINSGFVFEDNMYDTSLEGRQNLNSLVSYVMVKPEVENITVHLPNDTEVILTPEKVKILFSSIMENQQELYNKCNTIKTNIDAATTYEEAKAAYQWD